MTTPPDRPDRPLWGPDVPRDVDDELAAHLAEREAEYRREGMSADEARRRALERFGDLGAVHATLVRIDEAHAHRRRLAERVGDLWRDVRLAARSLRRSPGFAAAAVVTLALGIGATTAIFSVVDAVLLRPLPYRDPGRLVVAVGARPGPRGNARNDVAWPDYLQWRDGVDGLVSAAAVQTRGFLADGPSGPEIVIGARVSASFFGTLGVVPALGRGFTDEDDRYGAEPVVILSHRLWTDWFGGAPDVLGRTLALNAGLGGGARRIVGVLPASFESAFHLPGRADVWIPMAVGPGDPATRDVRWLTFVARLGPDVTYAQARARVETLSKAAYADRSSEMLRAGYTLIPLDDYVVGTVRPALLLLLGAVAVLLLIACGNVSGLVLARALGRRRDLAIRSSLGAGRGRLVRQLFVESLVLAAAGGGLGLLLAAWSRGALLRLAPADIPRLAETATDWRVLTFAAGASIAAAVLFGTFPAARASRLDLVGTLKSGGAAAGAAHARARRLLMAAEVALTVVLLAAAGLLLVSFDNLLRVDPGFDPARVLAIDTLLPPTAGVDEARLQRFFAGIVTRAAALPGATGAAAVDYVPLGPGYSNLDFTVSEWVEGPHQAPDDEQVRVESRHVSPGYFQVMRIPVERGRAFRGSDTADAPPVVIVNAHLARHLWGDADPIGRRLRLGPDERPWVRVVGVAGDVHHFGLDRAPGFMMYRPMTQQIETHFCTLLVRAAGDPLGLAPVARAAIRSVEPRAIVRDVRTLNAVRLTHVARPRFYAFLVGSFAALAALLAAVGLFGLMAYTVGQRTSELGVRMALGAPPDRLLRDVVRDGLRIVTVGLVLGVAGALAVTRVLASLLFDLSATDPRVFAGAAVLLLAVGALACYLPARRVLRVDPLATLRAE